MRRPAEPNAPGRDGQRVSSALRRLQPRRGNERRAAPVILIWDNLNTHRSKVMRTFTGGHPDWLTVIQLPAYASDLNPVEGDWSSMKISLGNLAACTLDQLTATIRNRLRRIKRQPALINALMHPAASSAAIDFRWTGRLPW